MRHRALGALLALLVQAAFLLLAFLPHAPAPLRRMPRETILILPPLPRPQATTIDARGPREEAPSTAPPVIIVPPPAPAAPALAPPSGLAGFGRSLFGCAPERYAMLSPEERAHCPKPGEGLAINQDPDPLRPPRSRSKDEALWLEQKAEAAWRPECAGALSVARCMIEQSRAEHKRVQTAQEKLAADKARALQEKIPMPPLANIGRRN